MHTSPLESATTECYSLVLALVVPGNEVNHAVPSRPCQIRMVLCPGAAPALTPSLVQRTAPRDGKPTTHPHMIQADKLLCTCWNRQLTLSARLTSFSHMLKQAADTEMLLLIRLFWQPTPRQPRIEEGHINWVTDNPQAKDPFTVHVTCYLLLDKGCPYIITSQGKTLKIFSCFCTGRETENSHGKRNSEMSPTCNEHKCHLLSWL